MERVSRPLHELGENLRAVSDELADPADVSRARKRLFAPRIAKERPRRWPLFAVAAAALAVVLGLYGALRPTGRPLSFELGDPARPGEVGAWVAASDDLEVRFSEGTRVVLAPGARFRVTDTTTHGASVLLEQGSLHAAVVESERDDAWRFRAGPFTVHVRGTAFDVAWSADSQTFTLVMKKGRVEVDGPVLADGQQLVAGQRLEVSVARGDVSFEPVSERSSEPEGGASEEERASSPEDAASGAEATKDEDATAEGDPAETASAGRTAAPRPAPAAEPESSWRSHLEAGRYRQAMDDLDDARFAALIAGGSSSQVLRLADAARFGGRPARAKQALSTARQRFGLTGRTAFLLGKIAADQLGAPGEAVRWFQTYLQEAPDGPLAEQALGRVLELSQGGDADRVRSLAERYLARYPEGAYAPLARKLSAR